MPRLTVPPQTPVLPILVAVLLIVLLAVVPLHSADAARRTGKRPLPPTRTTTQPEVLPPALVKLRAALAEAVAAQQQAAAALAQERARQAATVKQLDAATIALLRARRVPAAVTTVYALAHNRLQAPGVLAASQRQQARQLSALQQNLQRLLALNQRADERLARLQQAESTFTSARTTLARQESTALAKAAIATPVLEKTLAAPAPTKTAPTPAVVPPPPAPEPEPQPQLQASSAAETPPPADVEEAPPVKMPKNGLPVAGRIVADFRPGSALGTAERPDGLTFRASAGAPVVSVGTGQVLYSGPFKNFGGLIIIEGKPDATGKRWSGTHVVYANLAELNVEAGARVTPGTRLGRLASSEAQPTLYFEVRRSGRPVNPRSYLPPVKTTRSRTG